MVEQLVRNMGGNLEAFYFAFGSDDFHILIDLPGNVESGLVDAMSKLKGIKGIATVELERGDIVRHRLVQNIVNAYERNQTQ